MISYGIGNLLVKVVLYAVVSPFVGLLMGEALRDIGRLGGVGAEIRGVVVGGVAIGVEREISSRVTSR